MPRKHDHWSALDTPQTLPQRKAFIDACVAWLVREEEEEEAQGTTFRTPSRYPTPPVCPQEPETLTVYTDLETRRCSSRTCALCSTKDDDVRAVIANPFSQRHLLFLCVRCRSVNS